MRYSVFLDTNILLSGIFFEGNESRILDLVELDLATSEDAVDELRRVIERKLKYLKERTLEIALSETEKALSDVVIIPRTKYSHKMKHSCRQVGTRGNENFIPSPHPSPLRGEGKGEGDFQVKQAETLMTHKKDIPILAAVLYVKPDYFLTGDVHFFTDKIKKVVNVITAGDFLVKIK